MTARGRAPTSPTDQVASLVVIFAFSVGLGAAAVVVPLVALDAGYDAAAVGFLVATAAACQFAMRLTLPWLLGWFPDRTLIAAGSLATVGSFGLLLLSTALPVFVVAQLLQGAGRALFWTSNQTHAVRSGDRPVERLVVMTMAGNAGTLTGPAMGGMLAAVALDLGLALAVGSTAVAVLAAPFLQRLPRYDRRAGIGTRRLLRREGVDLACWSSVIGGTWWSMVGSYVPVMAVAAGIGAAGLGGLVTLSEGAGMVALFTLRRVAPERIRPIVVAASAATVAALIGLAATAFVGPAAIGAFIPLMILGGVGSGTVTALSAAVASLVAGPAEQGDALAVSGTFRAGALLVAPATVGALLSVVAVPGAVALVALAAGLPGALLPGVRRTLGRRVPG